MIPRTILFLGDIVGGPGRDTVRAALPLLREQYELDFIVVNGENAAGGLGITPRIADEIFALGVDAITLGNHTYKHREVYGYLDSEPRIIRPANHYPGNPGHGSTIVEKSGCRLAVINICGEVMMQSHCPPFDTVDQEIDKLRGDADLILVDFHAETTSEKVAMGWHLDGRVTGIVGTHTHVPTADGRVLPGGSAYITDVGMTGSRAGVIGVQRQAVLNRLRTGMPTKFDSATGDEHAMGVVITSRSDGLARSIEQVLLPVTV